MNDQFDPFPPGFKRGWVISLSVSLGLVVLAAMPPFLSEGPRYFVMELFSSVCHQLPDRSVHIDGIALGVCHRCFGTYVGLPAAALVFASVRGAWPFTGKTAPVFLALAVLPAAIDWGVTVAGLWENTPLSRSLTGLLLGCVAGYYLTAAIVDGFVSEAQKKLQKTRDEG